MAIVRTAAPVRLGLRANLAQFALLVGVNALVGGMIGQERTVLPLLAERVFHLHAFTAALTFIVAFGAVAAPALATGYIAAHAGLRPEPFYLGVAYAGLGLGVSALFVRETRGHAHHEAAAGVIDSAALSTREVFVRTSFREPALSAVSQAGLVNNLNDGLAWGIFPLFFASHGLSVGRIGVLAALYPAVWGLGQLLTGALSDRWGRKRLIVAGMWTQAVAIATIAATHGFASWALGPIALGSGT